MGFFSTIKSAIYNPDFYSKIKTYSLGKTLGYFFLLAFFLTLINTVILSYELAVKVPQEIKNFLTQAVNSYPQDLEVSISNGQVSTNTEEPVFLPLPQNDSEKGLDSLNNILVIDTKTPYSATQFEQYKTLFWLTKDSLFYQSREYDQRSIDLTDIENFTVNQSFIESIVEKINPWLKLIGPALIIIVFFGLFIGFSLNLIYFLFLGVLVFFLASIFKWGLNYSASYKAAVYSSTLSFFVDLALFNTGLYTGFYGFPFLFTLTSLCIATINFQSHDIDNK
jgi:hypothetical protein